MLAQLPVDVHLGKLCVLGHVFGCLEEATVVGKSQTHTRMHVCTHGYYTVLFTPASALSLKSMFVHPYKRPMDGYK